MAKSCERMTFDFNFNYDFDLDLDYSLLISSSLHLLISSNP